MSLYKLPFHLNSSRVNPPAVELATSRWYEMVILYHKKLIQSCSSSCIFRVIGDCPKNRSVNIGKSANL